MALGNFSYLCIRKVIHFGKLFLATKEKSFPKHKISAKDKTSIIVINKNDLKNNLDITKINNKNIVYTDTKSDNGIDTLKDKIKELFNIGKINYNEFVYVSSLEQLNKLQEAKESMENIKIGLEKEEPIDIIEIDIKNIWNILGEITGESYTEELLDNLFSDFCVGK